MPGYRRLRAATTSGPAPVACRMVATHRHQGARAVAEEGPGHQVRHRGVGGLEGERAELGGQQQGRVAGTARQMVVDMAHSGGAGRAAQAEERYAPYVGTQARAGGEAGLQRGRREPGHRGRHDQIDLVGRQSGVSEGEFEGPGTELQSRLDEEGVRRAEVVPRAVPLQRQREMSAVHPHRAVDAAQQGGVGARWQEAGQRLRDLGLGVVMRREHAAHCENTCHSFTIENN